MVDLEPLEPEVSLSSSEEKTTKKDEFDTSGDEKVKLMKPKYRPQLWIFVLIFYISYFNGDNKELAFKF